MSNKTWAERREESNRLVAEHKAKMAAEYGLVDHPKLDAVYQLAWDYGHAAGFGEVESYFSELAKLVK
jgi:lipopolysaccharide biosynthesis regulator YciM